MQGVILFSTAWLISLGSSGMVSEVKPNFSKVGEKATKKAVKQLSQTSASGGLPRAAAVDNGRIIKLKVS